MGHLAQSQGASREIQLVRELIASSKSSAPDQSQQRQQQEPIIHQYEPAEQKRRPGRPRGSKNRRRESQPPTKPSPYPTANGSPQSAEVNPQNQQYYEFQWRVLQLCGEFYSAAEELVVSGLILRRNRIQTSRLERSESPCHCPMLPFWPREQGRPSRHVERRQTRLRHAGMFFKKDTSAITNLNYRSQILRV